MGFQGKSKKSKKMPLWAIRHLPYEAHTSSADRLEAKQLRPCLLSKGELRYYGKNQKSMVHSGKKQGVVTGNFLIQIYRPSGLVAHRGWVRLVLDRRCLVSVPNVPRHHTFLTFVLKP